MNKGLILLVEDNKKLLAANRRVMEEEGHSTLTAVSLAEARKHLKKASPDAVVLDLMLPDGSGLDFLKELRGRASNIPVLLLTALDTREDVVNGLKAGGDDYLTKPYDITELAARVDALLRRASLVPETIVKGSLKLDVAAASAFLDGADMLLTQKEFALLLLFTQHEGRSISTEYLYKKVWGQTINEDPTTVKTTVSRLRKKLAGSGYSITTERGEGYCFKAS